jgi:crotonobetainyl-CoA:carnitine CoA-transferase CaiB-like acyl-CoA transferase
LGEDWYEQSGLWQAANLNKRDLTLDLTQTEGQELFSQLVRTADVVVENFSVRVLEQFGMTYERLHELNPRLVLMRIPGYGLEGPWRDYVGWGNAFEQIVGLAALTGHAEGPPTTPGGYIDPIVGTHAGIAVQAALLQVRRTGEGLLVEVPQIEVGSCIAPEQVIQYTLEGAVPRRQGNRSPHLAPQGVYPVQGPQGWLAFSVCSDEHWSTLVELLHRPQWALDPRLRSARERLARHDALDAHLAEWTRNWDGKELEAVLLERGIPAATTLTPATFYDDPQLQQRDYFTTIEHPRSGMRTYPGWPAHTDLLPAGHHRMRSQLLGEHNATILYTELGLSPEDLERLKKQGIVGDTPLGTEFE